MGRQDIDERIKRYGFKRSSNFFKQSSLKTTDVIRWQKNVSYGNSERKKKASVAWCCKVWKRPKNFGAPAHKI